MQQKLRAHRRMRTLVLAVSWAAIVYGWYVARPSLIAGALVLVNLYVLVLMYRDKQAARHKEVRTPEGSLLLLAALGGAAGLIAGMFMFRHKTRHPAFRWGGPIFLIIHILLIGTYI